MRQIAEDRELDWYPRSHAVQYVVADASGRESTRLEDALDWLAALCADTTQDPEFRVMAAHSLLDQPRERHRQLMEELVELQGPDSWLGNSFNHNDIDRSFAKVGNPEWKCFDNPWHFYEPDEIQRRWLAEAREQEQDLYSLDDWEPVETYVREQPKIGRNNPCPCGSGKKYKKCCINKLH